MQPMIAPKLPLQSYQPFKNSKSWFSFISKQIGYNYGLFAGFSYMQPMTALKLPLETYQLF